MNVEVEVAMLIYTERPERWATIHNVAQGHSYRLRVERMISEREKVNLTVTYYPAGAYLDGRGNYLFGGEEAKVFWRELLGLVGFPTGEGLAGALQFMEELIERPYGGV